MVHLKHFSPSSLSEQAILVAYIRSTANEGVFLRNCGDMTQKDIGRRRRVEGKWKEFIYLHSSYNGQMIYSRMSTGQEEL